MMFEKITYADDFPINITISNIKDYPIHYHQDIEFVYVLKGSVLLKDKSSVKYRTVRSPQHQI